MDPDPPEGRHAFRESGLAGERRDDQRLLMGPDPAGSRFLDRQLKSVESGRMGPGGRRFQHMDLHQILFRIMEDQADEVERRYGRKTLREGPKQRLEVTVSRDGLGHFQ